MRTKYNWLQLKSEFLQGNWMTISDFLRNKGIANNSRNPVNTTGWRQAKKEIENKIISRAQDEYVVSESEIRIRQQQTALQMQRRALQELQDVELESSEDVRRLLVSGLEQERSAVGITSKDVNLTQVNITSPKTNLDKMIEEMSYFELLELIGELKRLKEQRNEVTK